MISMIRGTIIEVKDQQLVVDVGAFGLTVQVAQSAPFTVGSTASLAAYMHWNQEQGPSLFGFSSEIERAVFLQVISCSGLGPKIALAILADLGAERFIEAVQSGSEATLSKVSGIGAKKAEQMIVQLKHKVSKLLKSGIQLDESTGVRRWQEVSDVLSSLNYSRPEISAAMKWLQEDTAGADVPFDQLIRRSLSFLAKKA